VTFQTVEDLKPARELNSNLKIAILPNRIHGSTKNKTIQATLNQLDAVVLDNFVPSKNLFTQSSTILAEKEYLNIAKEILTLL
jgi:chromosome partitioning protein